MKCTLLDITSNHRVTCPFNIDPYRWDTCIIKLVVRRTWRSLKQACMKESEIQSWKYVCHQHDLIISLSFPPLRLTLRFDFSRNYKNASLKIKAASWRRFPFKCNLHSCLLLSVPLMPRLWSRLHHFVLLPADADGRRRGGEVIQQRGSERHRPGVTGTPPPLCLWAVSLIETLPCFEGGVPWSGESQTPLSLKN